MWRRSTCSGRRYCAEASEASTCVDAVQNHVASQFSACELTSDIGASIYKLRSPGAETGEMVSWLHREVAK